MPAATFGAEVGVTIGFGDWVVVGESVSVEAAEFDSADDDEPSLELGLGLEVAAGVDSLLAQPVRVSAAVNNTDATVSVFMIY
jgi:hypothetical protein